MRAQVSIHSPAELLKVLALTDSGWIGLHDSEEMRAGEAAQEGTFIWTDGSAADFLNWRQGEPNGTGDHDEDCVHLKGDSDGTFPAGQWNDRDCSDGREAVCGPIDPGLREQFGCPQ